jgi:hypothetical protein
MLMDKNKAYLCRVGASPVDITPEDGAKLNTRYIAMLIHANCLDFVQSPERSQIMCVDDTGLVDGKPQNAVGTEFYHRHPWARAANAPICGDVVIAPTGMVGSGR